ncbi:MAG TPA: hypothetical protein VFT45_00905 [Longimicrobium sp.]|nr:hypothetical protein [Longimicrobium sp.]
MPLSAFTDSIAAIIAGLRGGAPSHARVNGAASGIDHLGRRLHGLGCVRDREIADCFTAAVGELGACHPLPEEDRGDAVAAALRHLEAALAHAEAGFLPPARSDKEALTS